jgi:hypothetical protein
MPAEDDEFAEESPGQQGEFVPAVVARSLEEAQAFRELLEEHEIPALVTPQGPDETEESAGLSGRGVAVLVPEELLDEASEILAEQEDPDPFEIADQDDDDLDDEDELELELEDSQDEGLDEDDELEDDEEDGDDEDGEQADDDEEGDEEEGEDKGEDERA